MGFPEAPQRPDEPAGQPTAEWVSAVARSAAAEAAAPVELLGEYLVMLAEAALSGRRPQQLELAAVRRLGERAAEQGVDANRAVDLYLTAAWQLWQEIPMVVRNRDREKVREAAAAVLRVVNDAVEVLVEGHQAARRQMIRQEESSRRELIDDLLRGDADVSRLVQRAEPFGLDLGRAHQVLLAAPVADAGRLERAALALERVVVDRFGDRDVLVAIKDELLVVLIPAEIRDHASGKASNHTGRADDGDPATFVHTQLGRQPREARWQVAAGRPYPGAYGVARSYEEAREALLLARRLHMDAAKTVQSRDLLAYRVLGRDRAALVDLVETQLLPLSLSRGGAEPLLQTLETYFATGAVATETARRLHMSVRTVTYRLARVKALTGQDPADPAHRLALQMAVVGARLLDWPAQDLPRAARLT
ncbi:MAG: Sugar diacid utilization regulator SdaR [uncultured Friedmanniella sp.]|uniref:Sugar diacid utilization regulator SdaR n=1 Tax=uncultured Friedmanniella sp. TaxID=335381 RepID=A0A6J4K5T5_9ACTN|nr:helix-turn-helix domain-containing protein [uncultured Friedmanniella sp.]CAA9296773.1 MAG: Sugar diacid utilization regulator SdaR [uncultured Friedmanniella sp.]